MILSERGEKKEERAIVIRSRQRPRQTWRGPSLLTSWGGSCGALASLLRSLRDELLQRVIEVIQDQLLLTLSLPIFSSLSVPLTHFSLTTLRWNAYVPVCLHVWLSVSLPAFLLSFFFCSHHCLLSTFYLSFFHIISTNFPHVPFLSTLHVTLFPHLLVMALNVTHPPNNCRYRPDMQESKAEGKSYPRLHKSPFRQSG